MRPALLLGLNFNFYDLCMHAKYSVFCVAGSLAVEMCCGVIQHPQGVRAPAACHDPDASSGAADSSLPLGPVPHMIRRVSIVEQLKIEAAVRAHMQRERRHVSRECCQSDHVLINVTMHLQWMSSLHAVISLYLMKFCDLSAKTSESMTLTVTLLLPSHGVGQLAELTGIWRRGHLNLSPKLTSLL